METEIQGKKYKLRGPLSEDTRRQIAGVIERHLDAFAWSAPDMPSVENGAYRLETLDGGAIPRTWNATHLKFYFS